MTILNSKISSIKAYLPPVIVSNASIETQFGLAPGSIEELTGLRARRHALPDEHPTDMGMKAIELVLAETGFNPQELDLVISANASKDQSVPTDAMNYAHKLGLEQVQTCHLEVVCLSFIQALEMADLYIRAGKKKAVLVVSAEKCSKVLDPNNPETWIVLGDGAAAALLQPTEGQSRIEATRIYTLPAGKNIHSSFIKGGGTRYHPFDPEYLPEWGYFKIDGSLQYKLSLRQIPRLANLLLSQAGLTLSDIDYVIPHQIIPRFITTIASDIGFSLEKIHINPDLGNQAAASIPVALAQAVEAEKVRRGSRVLLIGGAAGFTVGGAILQY
jgi:3-oxoacyl-[acyl-carrier-protein] synthase-3